METWLQVMFSGISIAQTLYKKTIEAYHHLNHFDLFLPRVVHPQSNDKKVFV